MSKAVTPYYLTNSSWLSVFSGTLKWLLGTRQELLALPAPTFNETSSRRTWGWGRCSYRCVEESLGVHGHVQRGLHSLDGHDPQTYWDQVKQSWRARDIETDRERELGSERQKWSKSRLIQNVTESTEDGRSYQEVCRSYRALIVKPRVESFGVLKADVTIERRRWTRN